MAKIIIRTRQYHIDDARDLNNFEINFDDFISKDEKIQFKDYFLQIEGKSLRVVATFEPNKGSFTVGRVH